MQKVQLIDVESSKRNAALPLHLACRGKLTETSATSPATVCALHLACRGKLTDRLYKNNGALIVVAPRV